MKNTGNRAMIAMALLAGAIGGAASARLLAAPSSAFAAQPSKESLTSITARQFQVMDSKGNVRAKLDVSGPGLAQLGLYDQLGVERAALAVTKQGTAMMALSGDDGKPRAEVNSIMHHGPVTFALLNPDGSAAAQLLVDKDKRSLVLADSKGKPRLRAELDTAKNGKAVLTIYDKNGKAIKKIP